ncbi:MAG: prepilin-type N-terminal cleavage/methylation domain-containing protein [Fimbriimonadaceae bacterium]|nr:prepilin-type N-terminal cleavage/methylation domain-containing protein [Fimbriimonadaceae bacterium]
MRRKPSAFSLVELLIAIAIVAVIAAILLVVFMRVKESGKRTQCLSNLHQLGLSISMYQTDWDGQNPKDQLLTRTPRKQYVYEALKPYFKTRDILHCPDQLKVKGFDLGYVYRSGPRQLGDEYKTRLGLDPMSVVFYCQDHLQRSLKEGRVEYVDFEKDANGKYIGIYQVVRNDTSTKAFDAKLVEEWVTDGKDWWLWSQVPAGVNYGSVIDRFPGEPWPPEFE